MGSKVLAHQLIVIEDRCSAHCKGAGQGAGNKVPRAYGGHAEGLLRTHRARNAINSILAQKPSEKTLGVFWKISRTFVAPKNAWNAETKRQSGAVPIQLLALSASTTSAYSSLGVSQELNPQPQLLKTLVNHSATSAVIANKLSNPLKSGQQKYCVGTTIMCKT